MKDLRRDDLVEEILDKISEEMITDREEVIKNSRIGVHSGLAGICMFLFYMNRYKSKDKYYEIAWYYLEKTFEKINNKESVPAFCTGVAGASWVVNHLLENHFIDDDNYDILNELDVYLYNSMQDYMKIGFFDFFHGSTGIALYFIKRVEKNKNAILYLRKYVEEMQNYIEYDESNGYCKLLLFDGVTKKYDLGLAHGLSSIIVVLSKILKIDSNNIKLRKILEGFTKYLLSIEIITSCKYEALFPIVDKSPDSDKIIGKQIGWCYGDLGIGIAFWNVSKALDNTKYYNKAIEIFKHSSSNRDLKKQGIRDTCMCHGTSGIANVFTFLANTFKEKEFIEAQEYWINKTLEFYITSGLDGFRMFNQNEFKYFYSILEGTSGIGLTLLSYLGKFEKTDWGDIYLLS